MMAVQMLKPAAAVAEPTQVETVEVLEWQLQMQRDQQAAQLELQRQ